MNSPDPAAFLDLATAAREIGLSTKTVAKYISSGQMPGFVFGKVYRIPRVQWEDYKAGRWSPAPPPAAIDFKHRRVS